MRHGEKTALAVCSFPELEQDSRLLFIHSSFKYLCCKFRPPSRAILARQRFPSQIVRITNVQAATFFQLQKEGNTNPKTEPSLPNLSERFVWVDFYSFFSGFLLSSNSNSNVFNPSPLLHRCVHYINASYLPSLPKFISVLFFSIHFSTVFSL